MSFILDALKKSEAERQRQTGPTLLELRITQPRRRYPVWALLVGGLLGANVVVLLVIMLHRPAPATPAASGIAAAAASVATTGIAPAVVANGVPSQSAAGRVVRPTAPSVGGIPAAGATSPSAPEPTAPSTSTNPADYAPAVPASTATGNTSDGGASPTATGSAVAIRVAGPGDYAHLPNLSELGGNMPSLQLQLLDYSDRPSERYALINMRRVHEGDVLPDGTRVLAITRAGVAMEYRNQQFMLRPGGTVQSSP